MRGRPPHRKMRSLRAGHPGARRRGSSFHRGRGGPFQQEFSIQGSGTLEGSRGKTGVPSSLYNFHQIPQVVFNPPPLKHNGHWLLPGMGKLWGVREHPEREETPHLECGSSLCFQLQTNKSSIKEKEKRRRKLGTEG